MNTSFKPNKLLVTGAAIVTTALLIAAAVKPGETFPDLAKFGLEGDLPDTQGKVVLVDFFASWCGPCKESFPAMQQLHETYGAKGLVIVAVNVDEKKSDMETFMEKHPVGFPVVRDAQHQLVSAVKIGTMPSSFLLDREGRVVAMHRGFKGQETVKSYTQELDTLLK